MSEDSVALNVNWEFLKRIDTIRNSREESLLLCLRMKNPNTIDFLSHPDTEQSRDEE